MELRLGYRDQPRASSTKPSRQIAEMAYLLHTHPSVVYYACHNEPARMFVPTRAEDDDARARPAASATSTPTLDATLRAVDGPRHVHEASGIGDDVHTYAGSLGGGTSTASRSCRRGSSASTVLDVGPQADRFGDRGWPPDRRADARVGEPPVVHRLDRRVRGACPTATRRCAWADATEAYGAALAKHQTEWFRIHRARPFMGYRWHFWADWWGYAGGGLVDLDRVPKRRTGRSATSRPRLLVGLHEASVVPARRRRPCPSWR